MTTAVNLADKVEYRLDSTPTVSAINPPRGTTAGGTVLTITGTGFSSTADENTVVIDGVACVVSASTDTTITCTTGARPNFVKPTLVVRSNNQNAATTLTYWYIDLWSSPLTWGGESPPREGDSVIIPAG
jgi:hypothetical protein